MHKSDDSLQTVNNIVLHAQQQQAIRQLSLSNPPRSSAGFQAKTISSTSEALVNARSTVGSMSDYRASAEEAAIATTATTVSVIRP